MQEKTSTSKEFKHLGKVGVIIMAIGLVILYYDGYRLMQMFPTGYQVSNHPEIHIPIIGIMIAFAGTAIFLYNFSKGRRVI